MAFFVYLGLKKILFHYLFSHYTVNSLKTGTLIMCLLPQIPTTMSYIQYMLNILYLFWLITTSNLSQDRIWQQRIRTQIGPSSSYLYCVRWILTFSIWIFSISFTNNTGNSSSNWFANPSIGYNLGLKKENSDVVDEQGLLVKEEWVHFLAHLFVMWS